jgi:outer membrane protein assembly factor BamA
VGLEVLRDSRPNRFYPPGGSYIDFTSNFFAKNLGSKYSFQSYNVTFSKYVSLDGKQVPAYNAFACATGGEPPFYGNCIYGTDNQLRGYTAGRFLDRYMMTTQLEYRLVLPWRLGLVGFGGLGGVISGEDQLRTKQFLPDGGYRHSIPDEQKVPREPANRPCLGKRQFHVEYVDWGGFLIRDRSDLAVLTFAM